MSILSRFALLFASPHVIAAALSALFLLHALTYLHFFVDDEAIAYVYAQNVLEGRGLVYGEFEGPVEGFSNPLYVAFATLVLGVVKTLGLPKLTVFFVGKALSLACGAAMVWLTTMTTTRWTASRLAGSGAGLILALAGPLAVWSCSSLETVPFALLIAIVVLGTTTRDLVPPSAVTAAAAGAIFLRIDGFVYVGALGAALLAAPGAWTRTAVIRRLAAPAAAAFVALAAMRLLVFGEWLPLPLQTKVLYKLMPGEHLVRHDPEASYFARFFAIYPWPLLLALCTGGLLVARRDRRPAPVVAPALALTALAAYVAIVGDWMFGFRFIVGLLPFVAVLAGATVAAIAGRSIAAGAAATLLAALWMASAHPAFLHAYVRTSDPIVERESWWRTRDKLDPRPYFTPYYELYADLHDDIPPRALTANNQAGLLPFLLDTENIDDLGLGSRFYATLPTQDVIFTEVGRYHPLTNKPPLMAGHAYLLHREPRFIIVWRHLMRSANGGRIPDQVLDGHYRLTVAGEHQLVYTRTEKPVDAWKTNENLFVENVAHPSRVERAIVSGRTVAPDLLGAMLPYLRMRAGTLQAEPRAQLDLAFEDPTPVSHVFVHEIRSSRRAQVHVALRGRVGELLWEDRFTVDADEPRQYLATLESEVEPSSAHVAFESLDRETAVVRLEDLRVLGQTDALERHVEHALAFDAASRR